MSQEVMLKRKPQIYVLVGRPESGKSHCVKSMLYDYQKAGYFKFIVAFVRTKFNHDYDYLPDEYVHESFDEKKLKTHIEKLREWRKKNDKPLPPNFVIFDDLLGEIDCYSPWMMNWICSFRHTNTSIIMTAQYLMGAKSVSTCLQECTNVAFIFNTKFKNSKKALYEAYGQLFDNYDAFCEAFQRITATRFHCMVYNANEDDLEKNYLDFSAPKEIPEYKIKFKM
jgi:hypothetical protein